MAMTLQPAPAIPSRRWDRSKRTPVLAVGGQRSDQDVEEEDGTCPASEGDSCPIDVDRVRDGDSVQASGKRDRLRWRQRGEDTRSTSNLLPSAACLDDPLGLNYDAKASAMAGLCPKSKLSLTSSARLLQSPDLASDFASVLEGGAHHLKGIFCRVDERKLFQQLKAEIESSGFWRSRKLDWYEWTIAPEGGQRSTGRITGEDAQKLAQLPAHNYVLEHLASLFNVRPLSWWTNLYPAGRDSKNFHKDNFGQNITIGASFGATRDLTFRHGTTRDEFNFLQENGDVFAFREKVNNSFLHGMYPLKATEPDPGPRISVIMMARAR